VNEARGTASDGVTAYTTAGGRNTKRLAALRNISREVSLWAEV
jgi:hypothetical protein